jgi:hypothetical protein
MGNKMEKVNWQNNWMGSMVMGECENWQRKSYIAQKKCKHSKGGYGILPLGNIYTCHEFFQEHASLKKLIPKHFLTKTIYYMVWFLLATSYQQNLWNVINNFMQFRASELGCYKI